MCNVQEGNRCDNSQPDNWRAVPEDQKMNPGPRGRIRRMKKRNVLTVATAALITLGEVAPCQRKEMPPDVHPDMLGNVSVDARYPSAAIIGQDGAFDNETWSPVRPWVCWWHADENRMTAAQGMMRLGM
jgi:hypothetical protein